LLQACFYAAVHLPQNLHPFNGAFNGVSEVYDNGSDGGTGSSAGVSTETQDPHSEVVEELSNRTAAW